MSLMGSQIVLTVSLIGFCAGIVMMLAGPMGHKRPGLFTGVGPTFVGVVALFKAMGSFNAAALKSAPERAAVTTD